MPDMLFKKFPAVRMKQIMDYPPYALFFLERLLFLKWWSYRYADRYKDIRFLSASDSLRYIIQYNMSVIRFGDGEYGLLSGAGIYPPDSDWSQKTSEPLRQMIKELLSLHDPKILLAHTPPDIFLATPKEAEQMGMIASMHIEARMFLWRYLKPKQVYGHSGMFQPAHNTELDWELLRQYLSNKTVVIVTGGVHQLPKFDFGTRVLFVEAGKHNAFERRERILSDVIELIKAEHLVPETTHFLISLGSTAGYLVKELSTRGFIAWDTGHFFKFAFEKPPEHAQDFFVKDLSYFTPEEVQIIFDRYQTVQKLFAQQSFLRVPAVLKKTENTITFSFESLNPTVADQIFTKKQVDERVWNLAGKGLGILHRSNRNHSMERGFVHGDFCVKNLSFQNGTLIFFDLEPPPNTSGALFASHVTNTIYGDLAQFIFSLLTSPSYTEPWRFWKNQNPRIRAFLSAYTFATSFVVEEKLLQDELERIFAEWYFSLSHRPLKKYVKYGIVRISLWLHRFVYACF